MFCVFRAVHKFDFRLVLNATPNKWRPVKGNALVDTLVLDTIHMFSPHRRGVRELSALCRSTLE